MMRSVAFVLFLAVVSAAAAQEPAAPTKETREPSLEPRVDTSAPMSKEASSRKGQDRLELEATQITGNRELPKVLYIVPWKRADLGDLLGRPVNSLLDEVLEPVDRDVFKRENRYYHALTPQRTPEPQPEATGPEK